MSTLKFLAEYKNRTSLSWLPGRLAMGVKGVLPSADIWGMFCRIAFLQSTDQSTTWLLQGDRLSSIDVLAKSYFCGLCSTHWVSLVYKMFSRSSFSLGPMSAPKLGPLKVSKLSHLSVLFYTEHCVLVQSSGVNIRDSAFVI